MINDTAGAFKVRIRGKLSHGIDKLVVNDKEFALEGSIPKAVMDEMIKKSQGITVTRYEEQGSETKLPAEESEEGTCTSRAGDILVETSRDQRCPKCRSPVSLAQFVH